MRNFFSLRITTNSVLNFFLGVSFLLMMFKSFRLYFTWDISMVLIAILGGGSSLLYYIHYYKRIYDKTTLYQVFLCFSITLVFLYEILTISEFNILSLFTVFTSLWCSVFLILSDCSTQVRLLRYVVKATQIIVAISLVGWLLYLLNVPLPHYYSETDAFYTHTVYYLFILNGIPELQIMPRFAGMFLEPGHLGTICCLLLYVEGFNLKKKGNIILLLGVLFSLSLAAYGLLIGGVALYIFYNTKRGMIYVTVFSLFIAVIWIMSINYNSGENYLNKRIFERLIFEDGEMMGANRTTDFFQTRFDRYVISSDIWFGVGREAFDAKGTSTTNILNGCAGWKRFYFLRGVVGCFLLLLFLFSYWRKYPSSKAGAFLILFLVANMIRDYPLREYFLFIYLLSIPVLYQGKVEFK